MKVQCDIKTIFNQYVLWYIFFYLATDLFQSIAYYLISQIAFISVFFIAISKILSGSFDLMLYKKNYSNSILFSPIDSSKSFSLKKLKDKINYHLLLRILFITLMDISHYLLIGFTGYPSTLAILQCYQIVFIAVLSKIRLRCQCVRRHTIGVFLIIMGILIGSIIKVEVSMFTQSTFLILLSSLFFSLKCIEEKSLLNDNLLYPYTLLFSEGIIGLILYMLFCFITSIITCRENWIFCTKYHTVFDFFESIQALFDNNSQSFILMLVYCLFHIGKNIRMLKLNANMSPIYIGIIDSIVNYINSIVVLLMGIIAFYQISVVILLFVIMVSITIMLFGSLIYIECIKLTETNKLLLTFPNIIKQRQEDNLNEDQEANSKILKKKSLNGGSTYIEFPLINEKMFASDEEDRINTDDSEKDKELFESNKNLSGSTDVNSSKHYQGINFIDNGNSKYFNSKKTCNIS